MMEEMKCESAGFHASHITKEMPEYYMCSYCSYIYVIFILY